MGLQINTSLTTKDGGSVASGAHIIFETYFPAGVNEFNVNMQLYRSQQAYIDGLAPIRGINEVPSLNFNKKITEADFTGLTPQVVHQEVKVYLEQFVGSGNVSIV